MLAEMVPVRPRIRMVYQLDLLDPERTPQPHVLQANLKKPYALYHQNVELSNKRKLPITERIIVVGCSSTAMSFLEELLFRSVKLVKHVILYRANFIIYKKKLC